MCTPVITTLATAVSTVPDSGATSLLLGLGILALGIAARLIKNRK
jgi:hypothetical protein